MVDSPITNNEKLESSDNFDFLFINKLDPPFNVEPNDLLDNSKYIEATKNNQAIRNETDKIANKCELIKKDIMKLRENIEKIKEKVKAENNQG